MAFVWLATYVVCIGLVCSFILFEVLDIDGSDFPAPPSNVATPIKLAEPPHEIKRALLAGPPQFWMLLPVVIFLVESAGSRRLGTPARMPSQPGPRGRRGLRIALPRASLADAASSA
jgi:hypothetical protein